jgi:hypothetical protein
MTVKQVSLGIILFLLALTLGLIVNFPVIQLFHVVKLPGNVAVDGVNGSIIDASVERLQVDGYPMSGINFKFEPGCLIKLAICYQVSSDEEGMLLNLKRSLLSQNIAISDSYIEIPPLVFDRIPNLLVKPAGDFQVNIDNLEFNSDMKLEVLNATLDWNNAGVEGEKQVIGNYTAQLTQDAQGIKAILSDHDSLLGVKGNVVLSWRGEYDADLEFQHKSGLNPSLLSVLDISARKSGLNQYRLKKKGMLPGNLIKPIMQLAPVTQ